MPPIRYSSGVQLGGTIEVPVTYSTFHLPNGLTVVFAPDAESNLVTVDVRYFVGAAAEEPTTSGLAHLVEHLLFEVQPGGGATLNSRLAAAALSFNANTTFDSTHFNSVALTPNLEALLEIEALRMSATCDQLSQELFDRERDVVVQELAQRASTQEPITALRRTIWGAPHPFARGVGGERVAALTKADACAFIDRHYAPSQAALIVGGPVAVARVKTLIARYFGALPASEPHVQPIPDLPKTTVANEVVQLPVRHPGVMAVFPLERFGQPERVVQDLALRLVASELHDAVQERADLLDLEVGLVGSRQRQAVALMVATKDEHGQAEAVAQIFKAIERALKSPSEGLLELMQSKAITELIEAHDDMLERGWLIADYCQFGAGTDYHGGDVATLLQTTSATLVDYGHATFSREQARVFYVSKQPGTAEHAELALGGEARRYELPSSAQPTATFNPEVMAHAAAGATPPWIDYRLPNGLRVVLVPRRKDAFFEARLLFPSGDADDPAGRDGLAETTATSLEMRTRELRARDFLALISSVSSGGVMSASTTQHGTEFRVRGAPSLASLHIWRMHALLENGEFDAQALREQQAQAAKGEDDADGASDDDVARKARAAAERRLVRAMWARLLGKAHPYLRSYDDELDKLTVAELESFRQQHYQANGAVLVVVGGFDPTAIAGDISELWGAWPQRPPRPPPPTLSVKPVAGPAYLALAQADRQLTLRLTFARRSDPRQDEGARLVASKLLEARIAEVRERLAATYGLSVDELELGGGSFLSIVGKVAPDRGGEVLREVLERLDVTRGDAGALALEVARARRKALELRLARASSSTRTAEAIVEAVREGKPLDPAGQFAAIGSVTTRQVTDLLRADLDLQRMVVAASGPSAGAALAAIGASDVQLIK